MFILPLAPWTMLAPLQHLFNFLFSLHFSSMSTLITELYLMHLDVLAAGNLVVAGFPGCLCGWWQAVQLKKFD